MPIKSSPKNYHHHPLSQSNQIVSQKSSSSPSEPMKSNCPSVLKLSRERIIPLAWFLDFLGSLLSTNGYSSSRIEDFVDASRERYLWLHDPPRVPLLVDSGPGPGSGVGPDPES